MGILDKLKQLGGKRASGSGKRRSSGQEKSERSAGGYESLPGGASGKEAASTNPQRALELAD
jgi:hypothetical protein